MLIDGLAEDDYAELANPPECITPGCERLAGAGQFCRVCLSVWDAAQYQHHPLVDRERYKGLAGFRRQLWDAAHARKPGSATGMRMVGRRG